MGGSSCSDTSTGFDAEESDELGGIGEEGAKECRFSSELRQALLDSAYTGFANDKRRVLSRSTVEEIAELLSFLSDSSSSDTFKGETAILALVHFSAASTAL